MDLALGTIQYWQRPGLQSVKIQTVVLRNGDAALLPGIRHLHHPLGVDAVMNFLGWLPHKAKAAGNQDQIPTRELRLKGRWPVFDRRTGNSQVKNRDRETDELRRTKIALFYEQNGNLRAVQIVLGHSEIESTVRYLGVDIEEALADGTEI